MWFRIPFVAAVLTLSILPAEACSCAGGANPSACEVPLADMIVRATVVSRPVEEPVRPASSGSPQGVGRPAGAIAHPEPWGRVKVTLSVSERFRGGAGDTLVVRTELGTDACGYPFEVGHEYLVFANGSQGNLTVTTCSATQPSKMAAARIEQLRTLRDGSSLPDLYGFVGTHPLRWDQTGWEQVQPVPALTVTAKSDSAEYTTRTTDDGLYRFRGLPRGRYQLSVEAPPGHRAFWGGNAEHPGASPGVPCAMNFEVFWDGFIRGTVLGRDGQPASGMITAEYTGPETLPAGPFGGYVKEGRFEILKLPPGRYRLMFLPVKADRPAGPPVYYPGIQAQSAATLIEVGEGEHVEGLLFTIF
jgi:Carboxypeptidase regulatory-like domain